MGRAKKSRRIPTTPANEPLRHAFCLLAACELGRWPVWPGPAEEAALRARLEALALLLDIMPRAEMSRLGDVVRDWTDRYPAAEPVPVAELRRAVQGVLARQTGQAANTEESYRLAEAFTRLGREGAVLCSKPDRISCSA